MKATVKWSDGMQFIGEAGSGHAIVLDGAPEIGGRNSGMRPMELVLLGLGGCTAMDVMLILRRGRQPVAGCRVELEGRRAETTPKVFTHIHLRYIVAGDGLDARRVERAVALSAEKYCSVAAMLRPGVALSHEHVIEAERDDGDSDSP